VKRGSSSSSGALLALLLSLSVPAWAADTGQFMFTNAEPLPVNAGGTVFFRVLAVNQGNETWEVNKTYLIAQVYDKKGKYLASTKRFKPTAAVTPGGSLPMDLKFDVPIQYSGDYTFRVFIVHNEQRIVQSQDKSFPVTPQISVPEGAARPSPFPITVGGNVVVGYRNDTGPNDWQADTSVNLSGTVNKAPFELNANTIHDQKKNYDFRTFLFNYHAPYADIGLGDVSPNFSPLSVSGSGVRGALIKSREIKLGSAKWVIDAVAAQVAAATDGVFERLMYGTQSSFNLPGNLILRGNYAQVEDSPGSLAAPGPSLLPARSRAAGGGIAWAASENLKVEGDWQYSAFEANKTSTAAAVTDNAWRIATGFTQPRWSVTGTVSRNGAQFVNLAAPGVSKDRYTHEGGLMLRPWDWITLNNSLSQSRDNLASDPAKTTSRQRALGSNAETSFPTRTRLTLGYTLNRAYGEPLSTQDNRTDGTSVGLNQAWEGGSVNFSYQRSKFTDRTSAANNLLTNTFNISGNWKFNERLSATLGETTNITRDEKDGSKLHSNTLSGSFSADLYSGRFSLQGSVSFTDTEDDDGAAPADRQDTNLNLQATLKVAKSLGLTLGGFMTASNDRITPASDTATYGVNVRTTFSF